MNYTYIAVLAILLPLILVFLGIYIHVIWFICFHAYRNILVVFPVAALSSSILWFKKKKQLSIIIMILVIDVLIAGFIVYELVWAIVSEY